MNSETAGMTGGAEATVGYVGALACGCTVAGLYDTGKPSDRRWIAETLGEWVRDGYTVRPATLSDLQSIRRCVHKGAALDLFAATPNHAVP